MQELRLCNFKPSYFWYFWHICTFLKKCFEKAINERLVDKVIIVNILKESNINFGGKDSLSLCKLLIVNLAQVNKKIIIEETYQWYCSFCFCLFSEINVKASCLMMLFFIWGFRLAKEHPKDPMTILHIKAYNFRVIMSIFVICFHVSQFTKNFTWIAFLFLKKSLKMRKAGILPFIVWMSHLMSEMWCGMLHHRQEVE